MDPNEKTLTPEEATLLKEFEATEITPEGLFGDQTNELRRFLGVRSLSYREITLDWLRSGVAKFEEIEDMTFETTVKWFTLLDTLKNNAAILYFYATRNPEDWEEFNEYGAVMQSLYDFSDIFDADPEDD